jgi:hypothetical protein
VAAAVARAEDLEAQLRHQQSESTEHTTLHEEQMFTLQAELAEASQQQVRAPMMMLIRRPPIYRVSALALRPPAS